MKTEDYLKAVKSCPRVEWITTGFSLLNRKPLPPQTVRGYVVRNCRANRFSVISDEQLSDSIVVRNLAHQSKPRRLIGFLVRHGDELKPILGSLPMT